MLNQFNKRLLFNKNRNKLNICIFTLNFTVMPKKKNITKNNLLSWYMDFVLEHSHQPKSVFSFAKENNFEEAEFYKYYGSFEAIENSIFSEFFQKAMILETNY